MTHNPTSNDSPIITSKKAKKNALKASQSAPSALDFNDQVALNRRAQRFQREHEIEKMKTSTSYGGYGGYQAVSNTSNTYGNKNSWGNDGFEDPNADPVRALCLKHCQNSQDPIRTS